MKPSAKQSALAVKRSEQSKASEVVKSTLPFIELINKYGVHLFIGVSSLLGVIGISYDWIEEVLLSKASIAVWVMRIVLLVGLSTMLGALISQAVPMVQSALSVFRHRIFGPILISVVIFIGLIFIPRIEREANRSKIKANLFQYTWVYLQPRATNLTPQLAAFAWVQFSNAGDKQIEIQFDKAKLLFNRSTKVIPAELMLITTVELEHLKKQSPLNNDVLPMNSRAALESPIQVGEIRNAFFILNYRDMQWTNSVSWQDLVKDGGVLEMELVDAFGKKLTATMPITASDGSGDPLRVP